MANDYFVTYTTPRGSVITLPFLSEQQKNAVVAALHPGPARELTTRDNETCNQCQGAGGWHEVVEFKTSSGATVTTRKWVNCRRCGGTGQTPKK